MTPTVAIDARDAAAAELRGWGRYTSCLVEGLAGLADPALDLLVLRNGGRGPEVLFEQVKLPLLLRRRRVDLVHAPNCFLPLIRPCPGVVTVHDLAFETWPEDFASVTGMKYRGLAPAAARSAERVICPSTFTAEDVVMRYGVSQDRVRIIPEAPALPAGDLPPPSGRYLLAVGDLRRKKNLIELVMAFGALHAEGAVREHRLVLAGLDTGAGPELVTAARGAPIELSGYVSDAQLDALVRGAELLIHPSLYEGFGLVVLEAMARGTPVLAARATALPETGGDAAAYFTPGTAGAGSLAAVLRDLLADPVQLADMAARGRIHAARYDWQRTAELTVAVYRELL